MESIIFVIKRNMTNKYIKRLLRIDSYISKSSGLVAGPFQFQDVAVDWG